MKKIPRFQEPNKIENIKWEYDVVYERVYETIDDIEETTTNLKKKVNSKCSEGWIPEGAMGVVKNEYNDNKYLFQTIIRPIVVSNDEQPKMTIGAKMDARPAYRNITLSNEF